MIITKNGDVLRNLEEQVAENKRLILAHYDIDRVLADVGITVVGDALQTPPDILGLKGVKWGEAYPVGYEPPYDYYVWSRPTPNEEDVTKGEWFNIGPLAIPGPRGFAGPQGFQGPRGESTKWYVGDNPNQVSAPAEDDLFLDAVSGDVYQYKNGVWTAITNIRGSRGATGATGRQGPQGIPGEQGPQGEPGLPGSAVTIRGILQGIDELEGISPADQEPGTAYLVKDYENNYIIWVALPEDNTWEQAGPLQASVVVVGGNIVTEFNADTKLDKVTTTSYAHRAYVVRDDGGQGTLVINSNSPEANSLVLRKNDGTVRVGTPVVDADATTKKYVDDGFVPKPAQTYYGNVIPFWDPVNETISWMGYHYGANPYTLVYREGNNQAKFGTPTEPEHAATKRYVDDAVAGATPKLYRHVIRTGGDGYDENGNNHYLNMVLEIISTQNTALNRGYLPETEILNLLAGTTAPVGYITAKGTVDNEDIAYISISRADRTITVFNEWDEVITAFAPENGMCSDLVVAIG